MNHTRANPEWYFCPVHPAERNRRACQCAICGMRLVPEGAKFALLGYVVKNPVMLAETVAVLAAGMAAIAMMVH